MFDQERARQRWFEYRARLKMYAFVMISASILLVQ
jgi:hypothetical protein